MKVYWSPQTRSTRALWMLEETGVPCERERVDIQDPGRDNPAAFLEASPMGKVPALVDGQVKMSESAAICLYIADRYAPGTLAPAIDGKDWILGDLFTAADVMLGSSVIFMRMFEMLPASDVLSAYADRCLARPAYQRALDLNEAQSQ